jgi:hypothetical protein
MEYKEIMQKNGKFNQLRKNHKNNIIEQNRNVLDQNRINFIDTKIRNRKEFEKYFVLHPIYFESTSISLYECYINGLINSVDYQYYIKTLIQKHIFERVDDFIKCIVLTWYKKEYLFPPASLIYNTTKIPIKDIKRVLNESKTYLEFKKKPKQKQFRMITAEYHDNVWQADLIDFSIAQTPFYRLPGGKIALYGDGSFVIDPTNKEIEEYGLEKDYIRNYNEVTYNKTTTLQFNYILVVIDVFSRYVWTYNLQNKNGNDIEEGFQNIVKSNSLKFKSSKILPDKLNNQNIGCPDILQTDLEKGIMSKNFQNYLKESEVRWWGMTGKQGAAICERVIQTLKRALWKVFEMRTSYKWIDVIDEIVKAYNNRVHSSIKMSPLDARKIENYNDVKLLVSKHSEKYRINRSNYPKFNIGDRVRVKIDKSRFEKGYTKTFTNETYVIDNVIYDGNYYYTLEGVNNKMNRKQMFYAEDLLLS